MANKLYECDALEDAIFDQLSDARFFKEVSEADLEFYAGLVVETAVDEMVLAAVERTRNILMPDGFSGTMYRKGTKK